MGNYHSRYAADMPADGSVTARLVARQPYVVLPAARVNSGWNCTSEGCGVHRYTSKNAPDGALPQFVIELASASTSPTVVAL